jgi:hypothetical protein
MTLSERVQHAKPWANSMLLLDYKFILLEDTGSTRFVELDVCSRKVGFVSSILNPVLNGTLDESFIQLIYFLISKINDV